MALYEPPYSTEDDSAAAEKYTTELSAALANHDSGRAVEAFLRRIGMPSEAVAGMRQSPGSPGMTALAPTLADDNAAMGDSLVPTDIARRVLVPSLCIAGGASPASLQFGSHALADVIPDAVLEILDNQTHDVSADAIGPELIRFFSGKR